MQQITWSSLIDATKPYRSKIIVAQIVAFFAVIFAILIAEIIVSKVYFALEDKKPA